MAECLFDRPLLQSHFDGECGGVDCERVEGHLRDCEECDLRHALEAIEIGLFQVAMAQGAMATGAAAGSWSRVDLDAPPTAFASRVMDRIARERSDLDRAPNVQDLPSGPATSDAPAEPATGLRRVRSPEDEAPSETAAPPRTPRVAPPPAGRLLRLPVLFAAAAAAAVAVFVFRTHEPQSISPEKPSMVARGPGGMRWRDVAQSRIAGSEWIRSGEPTDVHPGDNLHSPEASTIHLRLPERGRLEAGPSSWLAVGGAGEAAALEGGFTASAGGDRVGAPGAPGGDPRRDGAPGSEPRRDGTPTPADRTITVETPVARISTGGEVEISLRAPSGEAREAGFAWLAQWAANRRDPANAQPLPAPPATVAVVYARRGPVQVVLGGGPVRNSLERTVMLKERQALVILETKSYVVEKPEEDAPADSPKWTDGMPVPPGSTIFHDAPGGTAAPPAGPGPIGVSGAGPVRNSVERALSDTSSDPAARAYALTVAEGLGGPELIDLAAAAVADPAILVRARATRVLALNAYLDQPKALAALRRLATDSDIGVAVLAMRALRTLADKDAIPVLQPIVKGEAGNPSFIVRTYAFDALVELGDYSLVAEGAALAPEAEADAAVADTLRTAVIKAFDKLQGPVVKQFVDDPRPAVKAAAILGLRYPDVARANLDSASEEVRLACVRVLLLKPNEEDLDIVGRMTWSSAGARAQVIAAASMMFRRDDLRAVPGWLADLVRANLAEKGTPHSAQVEAITLCGRAGMGGMVESLLESGTPEQRAVVLRHTSCPVDAVIRLAKDPVARVREAALYHLLIRQYGRLTATQSEELIANALRDPAFNADEARHAIALLRFQITYLDSAAALARLVELADSPSPVVRRTAMISLGTLSDRAVAAQALVEHLADGDRETAEAAARAFSRECSSPKWKGPPAASRYPSTSEFPVVRALVAMAAMNEGVPGAAEAFRIEVAAGSSRTRSGILYALNQMKTRVPPLDPAMLSDPDPRVRLGTLNHCVKTAALPPAAVLQDLAADPVLWVRAMALALLSRAGDESARANLRELAPQFTQFPSISGQFPRDVIESPAALADRVVEFFAILPGIPSAWESQEGEKAPLARLSSQTRIRARIVSASHTIRTSPRAHEREGALQVLTATPCSSAMLVLQELLANSGPAEALDVGIRSQIEEAVVSFLGFTPANGLPEYQVHHIGSYFEWPDVQAQFSR